MSTSAIACPASWPGNQACMAAGTASSQGMRTGPPVCKTTTVRGLALTTASTSSS